MSVHSDWGDWLPRAVAAAEPDGVAVWYLGCNGLVLKTSSDTTVFVDPYLGTGDPPRTTRMIPIPFDPTDVAAADAVLATHEHTDHVHGPSQAPLLAETDATFYGPAASLAVTREEGWTREYDVPSDRLQEIGEGDAVRIGDLTVHVTGANDPDAEEPVGYVFEHQRGTVFHGGDARPGPAFADTGDRWDIDLGVLAVGSTGMVPDSATGEPRRTTWYNDPDDVVRAANQLRLRTLVPTHWDMWKGLTTDPTVLHDHARSFAHPRELRILEIGDRTDV